MTNTQQAVVHYALKPGAVELREMPVPEIGDEDVLLHVGAVAVCGSDIHQAHNTHTWPVQVPVILGHEFAGTIAAAGQGVKAFNEGDRVVSETAAEVCGECIPCRSGRYNLCPQRKGFGYGLHGAMTSYVRVPAWCLHHIPDGLPFHFAALAEPCAVAYHALCVNSTIRPGDLVVVIGPGPIGLLCARMAALSGANPLIVAGKADDADRLQMAVRLGATRTVNVDEEDLEAVVGSCDVLGAELVCEATGVSRPLEAALRLVRPDGQVTKVGWSPPGVPIDTNPLVQKNIRLQGSFSHTYPMWEKVIHLLADGLLMPGEFIGLKTGLGDWENAFESMHTSRVIKSVLLPEG
ncbi:MAG: alcohol dehydrogenase catalytic domain-containing protein [Calditrichaeota bacterium]|nr:alcohol dehydrogenase catalytic domain-containing protein [Calditrichota bacterium]